MTCRLFRKSMRHTNINTQIVGTQLDYWVALPWHLCVRIWAWPVTWPPRDGDVTATRRSPRLAQRSPRHSSQRQQPRSARDNRTRLGIGAASSWTTQCRGCGLIRETNRFRINSLELGLDVRGVTFRDITFLTDNTLCIHVRFIPAIVTKAQSRMWKVFLC